MSAHRLLVPTLVLLSGIAAAEDAPPAPQVAPKPTQETPPLLPIPTPAPSKTPTSTTAHGTLVVTGANERDAFAVGNQGSADKLGLPSQHMPQAVTSLPRELLESNGSFALRDALRSAPGVTLAAGENSRTGDSLAIRGFAANSDTYVDGLKDNGMYFRDTFNADHIEVLKGASSVLFGRGSTGGVINTVTKKPTAQWTGETYATAGTDDLYRVSAGFGGPLVEDSLGVRLDTYVHDADSFRDFGHVHRYGIAPGASTQISKQTTLLVQYFHQHEQSTMDYGVPMFNGRPADVPINTYYGFSEDSFQEFDVNQFTATLEHRFNQQVSLRNATRYGDYERLYRNESFGAVNYTNNTVARNQSLRRQEQESLINQTELVFKGQVFGRALTLLGGFEWARENSATKVKDSIGVPGIFIFDAQSVPSVGAGLAWNLDGTLNTRTEAIATTTAGYALAAYDLTAQLQVILGGRFDRYEVDFRSGNPPAVTERSRTDYMFSPRAGLVYSPLTTLSFYGSYGTSFNPSAEAFAGNALSATTEDLEPEQTRNYEVGSKTKLFDNRLDISLAVFRLEKINARTPDPVDATLTSLDGVTRTDGIELGAAGKLTDRWSLFAGGALMESEVEKANPNATGNSLQGKRPANAPRSSGSLWTTYDIGGGFTIGGGMYATSMRFTNGDNTALIPGYARFDLSLAYRFHVWDAEMFAQANVFNLFDTVYYDAGSGSSAYPGAPLSGQVTVGARF